MPPVVPPPWGGYRPRVTQQNHSHLRQTPFHAFHHEHGAQLVDFAGWAMPLRYGSVIEEHRRVRTSAGLFDVSHMGRLRFAGRHARRFLERVLTRRVTDMEPGTCRYALVCNERGGVRDDVLIYRFEDHWLMVCNASNREKLLGHFEAVRGELDPKLEDQTASTAMVAVQGPGVMDLIGRFSKEVPTLRRYGFCVKNLLILKMTISRTGYTGEDGIEVILPAAMSGMAVKLLMQKGGGEGDSLQPCGLAARDTLRLEAGMPLYGHELDEETDPFAAGLGWAVAQDKGDDGPFIGEEALRAIREAGLTGGGRKLVGLKLQGQRTPRQGMAVLTAQEGDADEPIGSVTSGCLSPTLGYPIAMAYIDADHAATGGTLAVPLGSQRVEAEVVALPFYKREQAAGMAAG